MNPIYKHWRMFGLGVIRYKGEFVSSVRRDVDIHKNTSMRFDSICCARLLSTNVVSMRHPTPRRNARP